MTRHSDSRGTARLGTLDGNNRVTLRSPGDLADALPYLLGYHPDDSLVLVALHGAGRRLGGRVRTGLPEDPAQWPAVAEQLVDCLVSGSEARGGRPDAAVLYLCRDPREGESGGQVMGRLRPLAQHIRTACGTREVPVFEALCVSGGRYWSYCCPDERCCTPDGTELPGGASAMAAAATYAGIRVQGSLKELERRLAPLGEPVAARQVRAFDLAAAALVPRMLGTDRSTADVRTETVALAERVMGRFRRGAVSGVPEPEADARDDAMVTSEEAATLVLGLQDRLARDVAAEWMEGADAQPALRVWRALARRCVHAYQGHAAAPLTLAGWVAWATGDAVGARVALGRALEADPEYVFGRLLHQAVSEGLSPEPLRRCMRRQRESRES